MLLEKAKWKFGPEQAQSLSAFTEQCPEHILFCKLSSSFPGFALAFSAPELLDAAADFGHGSALSIECTSTSVELKVMPPFYPIKKPILGNSNSTSLKLWLLLQQQNSLQIIC